MGKNGADQRRAAAMKLTAMISDLQALKAECLPDAGDTQRAEDRKNMDEFQRQKHALNMTLKDLRKGVESFNDMKIAANGERNAAMIKVQSENNKTMQEVRVQWEALKNQLSKDQKKGKMDPKLIEDRVEMVTLLGTEIKTLASKNQSVRTPAASAEDQALAERRERRLRQKREARKQRRKQRGNKGAIELEDAESFQAAPVSAQEQAFMDQVSSNIEEQDEMLDEISKGLEELKEISLDMNKNLKLQSQMLEEVDEKMDTTIREYKTANERLSDILEQSGGLSRWCPMFICLIILLALIGYIVNAA